LLRRKRSTCAQQPTAPFWRRRPRQHISAQRSPTRRRRGQAKPLPQRHAKIRPTRQRWQAGGSTSALTSPNASLMIARNLPCCAALHRIASHCNALRSNALRSTALRSALCARRVEWDFGRATVRGGKADGEPHLRRDRATSAPGRSHICARTEAGGGSTCSSARTTRGTRTCRSRSHYRTRVPAFTAPSRGPHA
jgi:hypothetical protein